MPLNPLHRIQLHRWGRFSPDGHAFTYAFCCWALTPQLPVAGHWRADGQPECYALPMDDWPADWLRLHAEAWARDHPDPALARAGRPHDLLHTGGMQHPQWSHVKLGGRLQWQGPPQKAVQQRLDMLSGLSFSDLVEHLCGPDPFRGVLAAGG
jgi:hypothetical protein